MLEGITSESTDEGTMQYNSPMAKAGQERLIQRISGLREHEALPNISLKGLSGLSDMYFPEHSSTSF